MSRPNDLWGDFWSFRLMITPIIMRVVFAIGVPIVALATIIYVCDPPGGRGYESPGQIVGGLFLCLITVPLWRIACELAMVAFNMNDRLGRLAEGDEVKEHRFGDCFRSALTGFLGVGTKAETSPNTVLSPRHADGGMKAVSPSQQREDESAHSGPTNPNLFPCPKCGHYISRPAVACPKCGRPVTLPPEQPSGAGGS